MGLRPGTARVHHLCLQGVFVPATAVLSVEGYCLVVVALHALDSMLDEEVRHLVYKRRIPAQVAEMVHPVNFSVDCGIIGSLKRLDVSVYVAENRKFHG